MPLYSKELISNFGDYTGLILWFLIPESPYYLALRNNETQCAKSTKWLMVEEQFIEETRHDIGQFLCQRTSSKRKTQFGHQQEEEEGDLELEEDERQDEASKDDPKCALKLLLMSSVMAFSRLCGVTQYSYYMVDIMEKTIQIQPEQSTVEHLPTFRREKVDFRCVFFSA